MYAVAACAPPNKWSDGKPHPPCLNLKEMGENVLFKYSHLKSFLYVTLQPSSSYDCVQRNILNKGHVQPWPEVEHLPPFGRNTITPLVWRGILTPLGSSVPSTPHRLILQTAQHLYRCFIRDAYNTRTALLPSIMAAEQLYYCHLIYFGIVFKFTDTSSLTYFSPTYLFSTSTKIILLSVAGWVLDW